MSEEVPQIPDEPTDAAEVQPMEEISVIPEAPSEPLTTPPAAEAPIMTPQPEEVVAAKWYTMGFLVVIGLLSIVGLVVMIIIARHLLGVVVN